MSLRAAFPPLVAHTPAASATIAAPGRRRRWWMHLVIVIFAVVAVSVLVPVATSRPARVVTTQVQRGAVEVLVTNSAPATVSSGRRTVLTLDPGARVTAVMVAAGERVRAGQALLAGDDERLRAALAVEERSIEVERWTAIEACTSADLAQHKYVSMRELTGVRLVTGSELTAVANDAMRQAVTCATAQARLGRSRAAADLARVRLHEAVLRAPFDGVVTRIAVAPDELTSSRAAGASFGPALEIADSASLYIEAPVPASAAGHLREGSPVRVTARALSEGILSARVTRIGSAAAGSMAAEFVPVRIELDDRAAAQRLLPGTSAGVEILVDTRANVLRVPSTAIRGERVFVVRDDRLVAVPIRAGLASSEWTEVVDGLSEGDQVVIAPGPDAQEGLRVIAAVR